jgi:lipopolysaccharide/colanic/teichoic acid biosynthesis glycosyltransferase
MQDITELSLSDKAEIAGFIRRDNLAYVNAHIRQTPVKDTFYTRFGKRALDIVIALIALVVTSPINLVIAVVTYFDVGTPIIFKQQRTGKDGKKFTIYKFRNMTNDTDVNGELLPAAQRVTKWGRFVRKTSLDELLNFVSILNGSMSVIGPRPLPDYYAERLSDKHRMMYGVRPGLECPTPQRADHKLSWQERLDNYVWYAENCSLWVDIRLALRVVQVALDRRETSRRSEAGSGGILGYDLDGNIIYTRSVPEQFVREFCDNHGFADLEEAIAARTAQADTGRVETGVV